MVSDFDDSFENDITTRVSNSGSAKNTKDESSIFSLKYYQKFFDVDANIVMDRIIKMSFYSPKGDTSRYLEKINKNPDFYGPYWIVVCFYA